MTSAVGAGPGGRKLAATDNSLWPGTSLAGATPERAATAGHHGRLAGSRSEAAGDPQIIGGSVSRHRDRFSLGMVLVMDCLPSISHIELLVAHIDLPSTLDDDRRRVPPQFSELPQSTHE